MIDGATQSITKKGLMDLTITASKDGEETEVAIGDIAQVVEGRVYHP